MSILRQKRLRSGFTVLDNRMIDDKALTWPALGLLTFLLSKPDGWEVREKHLVGARSGRGSGADAVRGILADLESAGYLRRGWESAPGRGRVRVTEIADYAAFVDGAEKPRLADIGFPDVGFPDVGEPDAIVRTDPEQELKEARTKRSIAPANAVAVPAKPFRPKPPPDPRVRELQRALEDWQGYSTCNWAAEGVAAKLIIGAGYTIDDTRDVWRSMKAEPFWQDKHLSLASVYPQLGAKLGKAGRRRDVVIVQPMAAPHGR